MVLFEAEDGILGAHECLEFRRVLFRSPAGAALFRLRSLSECINLAIHNLRRIPMRLLPLLAMLPLIACSGQSDATDAASTASAGGDPVAAQGSGTSRSYDVTGSIGLAPCRERVCQYV